MLYVITVTNLNYIIYYNFKLNNKYLNILLKKL